MAMKKTRTTRTNAPETHRGFDASKIQADEHELLARARAGDAAAFETLMKRYEDKVYSLAYRMMGDKDEAFDVLQEATISAYQHLGAFKGDSAFSTWLYRITVNAALMRKRSMKHAAVSSEDDDKLAQYIDHPRGERPVDWASDPVLNMENTELKHVLEETLTKLPDKYRSAVVLKDIEERPLEEVARILNISVPATKSRLHRARLLLRWHLEKYVRQVYGDRLKSVAPARAG
jgi:RNA polymerase sigma-70 factor (ECF subfamily)